MFRRSGWPSVTRPRSELPRRSDSLIEHVVFDELMIASAIARPSPVTEEVVTACTYLWKYCSMAVTIPAAMTPCPVELFAKVPS